MERTLRAVIAVLIAFHLPVAIAAEGPCRFQLIAELPLRLDRDGVVVEAKIGGKRALMTLNPRSMVSAVYVASAKQLGIPMANQPRGWEARNAAGERFDVDGVEIRDVDLGGIKVGQWVVAAYAGALGDGVTFDLGADVLRNRDVEVDYRNGRVRLFEPSGCEGKHLAYWSKGGAEVVSLESDPAETFPAKVNGRPIRGSLNLRNFRSYLSLDLGQELGFKSEAPGVLEAGCGVMLGGALRPTWSAPFESISIGNETIRDPQLTLYDAPRRFEERTRRRVPELVLGSDFLRAHRVLISRSQRKLYFTYTGGLVFPAVPRSCNETLAEQDPVKRMALYDAALARDPGDATVLIARGEEWINRKKYPEAIEDLSSALKLQPRSAAAAWLRARALASSKDVDRAITDFDTALAAGTRAPLLHVARGVVWADKGDRERALADLERALEMDPMSFRALAARGAFYAKSGEVDKAVADFEAFARLVPHLPEAHRLLAQMLKKRGDHEGMIASLDRAVEVSGGDAGPLQSRAVAHFSLGRFELAERDFAMLMARPDRPHDVIWTYLSRTRAGQPAGDQLRRDAASMKKEWPEPIVRYYLGEIDAAALGRAAAEGDEKLRQARECEARFHIGQQLLIKGERDAAQRDLERAFAECPKNYVEYSLAEAELGKIRQSATGAGAR